MTWHLEADFEPIGVPLAAKDVARRITQAALEREAPQAARIGQSRRLAHMAQYLGWVLNDVRFQEPVALLVTTHDAALAIAAEAAILLRERDTDLRRQPPSALTRLIVGKLENDAQPPTSWGQIHERGLDIAYELSRAVEADNRSRSADEQLPPLAFADSDIPSPLLCAEAILERAARLVHQLSAVAAEHPATARDEGAGARPEVRDDMELSDLLRAVDELQSRADRLLELFPEVKQAADRGVPVPIGTLDLAAGYTAELTELAGGLGVEPSLDAIRAEINARTQQDPRVLVLQSLAAIEVTGDAIPAVDRVAAVAANALEHFDPNGDNPDLQALLDLYAWLAHHAGATNARPSMDALSAALMASGISLEVIVPPTIDAVVVDLGAATDGGGPQPPHGAQLPTTPTPAAAHAPQTGSEADPAAHSEPDPDASRPQADGGPLTKEPGSGAASHPAGDDASADPEDQPEPTAEQPERPKDATRDAEEPANGTEPGIPDLQADLVDRDLPGLAACLAVKGTDTHDLLEMLGLAIETRSELGPCSVELTSRLTEARLDFLRQRLALAAAMRASIVCPTDVIELVFEECGPILAERPALRAITDKLLRCVRQRFSLWTLMAPGVEDLTTLRTRVSDLEAQAAAMLERRRAFGFARADRLWHRWIDRRGRLGGLIVLALESTPDTAESVLAEARGLRDSLPDLLDRDDRDLRGHGSRRLEGRARRRFVSEAEDVFTALESLLDARQELGSLEQTVTDHNPGAAQSWQELKATLTKCGGKAIDEVAEATLGGHALVRAVERLRELAEEPVPRRVPEPKPDEALRARLLALDLSLDDQLEPDTTLDRTQVLRAAQVTLDDDAALEGIFGHRLGRGDVVLARRVVDRIEQRTGQQRQDLRDKLEHAEATLQLSLSLQLNGLATSIDDAWTYGRLADESATTLQQRMERVRVDVAAQPDASIGRLIDRLREQLDRSVELYVARRRRELSSALQELSPPTSIAQWISAALDNGDIATAEDALDGFRRGDDLVVPSDESPLAELYACLLLADEPPEALRLEEILAAIESPPAASSRLDFTDVGEMGTARSAAAAAAAWFRLRDKRPEISDILAVLQALGFEIGSLDLRDVITEHSPIGAIEFDFAGRARRPSFAPEFGSESRGLRVALLVDHQETASPDQLLARAQGASPRPCVALIPRVLTEAQRRRIGALQRTDRTEPVLVIDTAVFLRALTRVDVGASATQRMTLPFTAVNPYRPFSAGDVPEEVFYGRKELVTGLLSSGPESVSIVYGGRRLGKSALLRAAQREADRVRALGDEALHAVVVDLKVAGIGQWNPPSALMPLLLERLGEELRATAPRQQDEGDRVSHLVTTWLNANPRGRIVLMLDEADAFLEADALEGFQTVERLQRLQRETGMRFKPVFAGLHQVKRFHDVPNQRLGHFGRNAPIRPLTPSDALRLIRDPLGALGVEFEGGAERRILTVTRNQPSLIQLVCHSVAEHVRQDPEAAGPPFVVTLESLETVLNDPALRQEIRERFELTLRLDPRYRIAALVVALETLDSEAAAGLRAREIRNACRFWWPTGFADTDEVEFEALLDELVELGIFFRDEDRRTYRLSSPTIARLLGPPETIEDSLIDAAAEEPPARFSATTFREVLRGDGRNAARAGVTTSPLTIAQTREIVRRDNHVIVVVGTRATGLDRVGRALEELTRSEAWRDAPGHRIEYREVDASVRAARLPEDEFRASLGAVGRRIHKIVFAADPPTERLEEWVRRGARATAQTGTKRTGGTVAGVIAVPATSGVMEVIEGLRGAETRDPVEGVTVAALGRWSAAGLSAWAHSEELPFTSGRLLSDLVKVTGGWPLLVDEVVSEYSRAVKGGKARLTKAISELEQRLATTEIAQALISAVGLADPSAPEAVVFRALVEFGEPVSLDRTTTSQLADISELPEDMAHLAYATLRAMQAIEVDERDRMVFPERVLAAAWSRMPAIP